MKNILHLALGLLLSVSVLQAHSDAFKPAFVDTLVDPYLSIHQGLATDDLEAAQTGATAFLQAMKHAPHEGEAHEEAMDLNKPVVAISEAKDIKAARTAFLDLSRQMITLVEHIGTSSDTPLYTAYCPMAFNNKGGQWIQSDETIFNPYIGSMMQHCGSIKKQIAGSEGHSDHSGHGKMPMMKGDHSGHSH